MAVEYLGAGQDDGTNLGRSSTDKIGFYGLATPVVRRSGAAQASIGPYTTTQTSAFGFSSSAQINEVLAQLKEVRDTLVAYGLWAGA